MRKRSKEEERQAVEEAMKSVVTEVDVAGKYGVRPGQIFEWRRAYKEGRLAVEGNAQRLLPVRLSEVSGPVWPASAAGEIYIAYSRPNRSLNPAQSDH